MISAIVVSSLYIAAQILSDITSLRIITIAGFSIDGGTFIYPITFTLRDMVHKVAGASAARALIFTAAGVNAFMALLFWVVSLLPPDMQVGPQAEFAVVLSPVWRIVTASILAEVVSELIDTEMYRFWVERVTRRYQWLRVLVSNSVAVPVDSLLFAWLAFGGVFPAVVVWSIVASNIIIKGLTTLVGMPAIYLVRDPKTPPYNQGQP